MSKIQELRTALGRHSQHFKSHSESEVTLHYKDACPPENSPDWIGDVVSIFKYDGNFCFGYAEITGCCGAQVDFHFPESDTEYLREALDILIPVIDKQITKGGSPLDYPLFLYMGKKIDLEQHDFLKRFWQYEVDCGGDFKLYNYDYEWNDLSPEMKARYKECENED